MSEANVFFKSFLLLLIVAILSCSTVFTAKTNAWSDNLNYTSCTGATIWSQKSLYDSSGKNVGFARMYDCTNGYMFTSANRSTYGYIYTEIARTGSFSNKLFSSRNGYGTQTNMLYKKVSGSCISGGATAGRWTSLGTRCF